MEPFFFEFKPFLPRTIQLRNMRYTMRGWNVKRPKRDYKSAAITLVLVLCDVHIAYIVLSKLKLFTDVAARATVAPLKKIL